MKQFLKFTLATIVGVFLASILGSLIFFGVLSGIASSSNKPVELEANSVYQLNLEGMLVDRSEDDPISEAMSEVFGQDNINNVGLDDVLANIEKAKNDPNILGIYLKGGLLQGGFASIKEIRDALIDFKTSAKFVIAYADTYIQSNYYLASVADKILINPYGTVDFKGLSAEVMFLKNTLDKIGVEMQIVKVGTYKSAVEPFINTSMSDANREQVTAYTGSLWNTMLDGISATRGVNKDQLNSYADEMMMLQQTEKLIQYNLVDSLIYIDEVEGVLKAYAEDYKLVKHSQFNKVPDNSKFSKSKIAIVYAVGGIDDPMSSGGIVSDKLVESIDKAAKDETVKAVVLRVSSPGGSAYGSEQIWRALMKLKEKKPLVVSMGDYAASGGYYISCMADTIVAQPNTITGSIGIFGMIPNIEGLNNKIGLKYDGVKTNKMSDAIAVNRAFRPEERALMQNYINSGYELFVKRCADGRGMSVEAIKAIAEGRVWTGEAALSNGLVDVLGGIDEAVSLAAEMADLTAYQIREYPVKEDFATKLMKTFNTSLETRFMETLGGEQYRIWQFVKNYDKINGIQARMPYEVIFR